MHFSESILDGTYRDQHCQNCALRFGTLEKHAANKAVLPIEIRRCSLSDSIPLFSFVKRADTSFEFHAGFEHCIVNPFELKHVHTNSANRKRFLDTL